MQVLVQASGQMRAAGGQLSGPGRLPVLLWVINQVGTAAGCACVLTDCLDYVAGSDHPAGAAVGMGTVVAGEPSVLAHESM